MYLLGIVYQFECRLVANCNEDIAEHKLMVIEKFGTSNHRLEDRKKITTTCFNIMLID